MAWFPYVTSDNLPDGMDAQFVDVDLAIKDASYRIRDALKSARFAVDSAGVPVDADVKTAIQDATIAQLAFWGETGDTTGAGAQTGGGSILSLSLPGGTGTLSAREKAEARDAPTVGDILRSCPGIDWNVGY